MREAINNIGVEDKLVDVVPITITLAIVSTYMFFFLELELELFSVVKIATHPKMHNFLIG